MNGIKGVASMIQEFVLKFANDWSMNLASMIAYNLITAIFPILLAILSIVGIVLNIFAYSHIQDVANALSLAFPTALQNSIDVALLLKSLVSLTGPFAVIALVALLWLGSNLFSNIENAFSIIFRIRGRDIVPQRLMAIAMVLVLTVLLPISLGAASLVTAGWDRFSLLLPRQAAGMLTIIGPLTSLAVLWLLFLVIYMVVPNFEVRFGQAWRGALVSAVLFGLLQLLFPWYLKIALSGNIRYGADAAGILVAIIWLWFFALIMVIGAQINAFLMGLRATPYDLARTFELVYEEHDLQADAKRNATPTRLKKLRRLLSGGARPRPPSVKRDGT